MARTELRWKVYAARFHDLPWATIAAQLGMPYWEVEPLYEQAATIAREAQTELRRRELHERP